MSPNKFVHLRSLSNYSFNEGVTSPKGLVLAAVDRGMHALALTDHYYMSGAIDFYLACQENGIKPIIGLILPVQHPLGSGELVFLVQDIFGWQSLCHLSSILLTASHQDPTIGITWQELEKHTTGLICLTGGRRGLVWKLLDHRRLPDVDRYLRDIASCFPRNLFVELQIHQPEDRGRVHELASIADTHGFPIVATHDIHYLHPSEVELQKTLSAIRQNTSRDELTPDVIAPPESYFLDENEMTNRFRAYPEAIEASIQIAERCHLKIQLDQPLFPAFPENEKQSAQEILKERAEQGAINLYGAITPAIRERLDHELQIISVLGYSPLFLIVKDIMTYARTHGVPVSSRGSAASSLVAHCLGITSPDPLALNLYFERFLNPARKSIPDIDIDLCSKRREKVIDYVYTKYGSDRVAMVATVNRYRYRSALREVAKAFRLPDIEIKRILNYLPGGRWGIPSGEAGIRRDRTLADLKTRFTSQLHHAIFDHASKILNKPRHLSIHPGGIVISPVPINNLAPTMLTSKGVIISQFNLDVIERLGLVKIDLLGIRGLSVLGDLSEKIYSWRQNEFRDSLTVLDEIPSDDSRTSDLVRHAQTIGCFQIESPGMRSTLREIDAHTPEDIMIALALYRPGPLSGGLKDAFVRRHLSKEEVDHLHPALSDLLSDTYGVILYQEQVLRIASELAGLSLADADLLRRAMSHFDPGERMHSLKERFLEGAYKKKGVAKDRAEMIWELMAAFAGYGFPKAHAASYAQIAWRSAWCKVHYPAEFIAAVLANWGGYYSQRIYLNEARRMGLIIQPPHINHAQTNFSVAYPDGEAKLYVGLDQVNSLTHKTQERIKRERPFHSLQDFLTRVDPRPIEAENLIKVGALRGLGTIPELLSEATTKGWRYKQPALFALDGETSAQSEWSLERRVNAQESILGAGLDAHPLELISTEYLDSISLASINEVHEKVGETVRIVGIRQTLQRISGIRDAPLYSLEIEDLHGMMTVFVSKDLYNQSRSYLRSKMPMVVEGQIEYEAKLGEAVLLAKRIWPVNEPRK